MTYQYHTSKKVVQENLRLPNELADNEKTPIQENRRPYLRKEIDSRVFNGIIIGDQRNETTKNIDKLNSQINYNKQLTNDIAVNNVDNGSPINRNSESFLMIKKPEYSRGLVIGKDIKTEREDMINMKQKHLAQYRIDIGIHTAYSDFFDF